MNPGYIQARIDYEEGLGQDDNPFPKGSETHEGYKWEMARLWDAEFKADQLQAQQGGTPCK